MNELVKYRRSGSGKLTATLGVSMDPEFKQRIDRLKPVFDVNQWIRDLIESQIDEIEASVADPDDVA